MCDKCVFDVISLTYCLFSFSGFAGNHVMYDPSNPASLQHLHEIGSGAIKMRNNPKLFVKDVRIKQEPEPPKGCPYQMVNLEFIYLIESLRIGEKIRLLKMTVKGYGN